MVHGGLSIQLCAWMGISRNIENGGSSKAALYDMIGQIGVFHPSEVDMFLQADLSLLSDIKGEALVMQIRGGQLFLLIFLRVEDLFHFREEQSVLLHPLVPDGKVTAESEMPDISDGGRSALIRSGCKCLPCR